MINWKWKLNICFFLHRCFCCTDWFIYSLIIMMIMIIEMKKKNFATKINELSGDDHITDVISELLIIICGYIFENWLIDWWTCYVFLWQIILNQIILIQNSTEIYLTIILWGIKSIFLIHTYSCCNDLALPIFSLFCFVMFGVAANIIFTDN